MPAATFADRLVASPCSNPRLALDDALAAYAAAGYANFEAFTGWAASALDVTRPADEYLQRAHAHGMAFTSLHLPQVTEDVDASLARSIAAARFADDLGVEVVLFKAASRDLYVRTAGRFLDATEALGVTPVLQNHFGTPITTLADFREVVDGIADGRMKTLLEVGHFLKAGVAWQDGLDLLGDSVALVHIKDMRDRAPVPFGTGEVEFAELFGALERIGYRGRFVVEMEVDPGDDARTLRLLKEARDFLRRRGLLQ